MADSYLAEIRIFGCNFAPHGWATCNGQLLAISQNTALFSLLGTNYGGNGTSTFGLPNFQGSAVMHAGQGPGLSPRSIGETGGSGSVTLLSNNLPVHNHTAVGNGGDGTLSSPVNNVWAGPGADRGLVLYNAATTGTTVTMSPTALALTGGNSPHNNYMPFVGLLFCIAMQGIYPARN
ncbi:MAG: tail fiber protein [Ferruginibacter sp.]